jgi:hypothetical protein
MRLVRDGKTVMSDRPSARSNLLEFGRRATGDVLIKRIGVGIGVQIALATTEASTVTVIEISEDVIGLVAPHIGDDRLWVIHADALKWMPQKDKRGMSCGPTFGKISARTILRRWLSCTAAIAGDAIGRAAGAATSARTPDGYRGNLSRDDVTAVSH